MSLMDPLLDEWTQQCMEWRADELWIGTWIFGRTGECLDAWGWTGMWVNVWTGGYIDLCMHRMVSGCIDGWMNRWVDSFVQHKMHT